MAAAALSMTDDMAVMVPVPGMFVTMAPVVFLYLVLHHNMRFFGAAYL